MCGVSGRLVLLASLGVFALARLPAGAQQPATVEWVDEGPGPAIHPGSNVTPSGFSLVSGAIEAVAAHPTNPNILFVATVNGGIWRTSSALGYYSVLGPFPLWEPLTDHAPSLSMGAIAFSRSDPSFNTLYAGFGRASHGVPQEGSNNGPLLGLLKTTDGGDSWTELARTSFSGQSISRILPTGLTTASGEIVLAATEGYLGGIWRSENGGETWVRISGADGTQDQLDNDGDGAVDEAGEYQLPLSGDGSDLVQDPGHPERIYAALNNSGSIHRSDDAGVHWTKGESFGSAFQYLGIRLAFSGGADALGRRALFAAVNGIGVFVSRDEGGSWTYMPFPDGGVSVGVLAASPDHVGVVFASSACPRGAPPICNTNYWRGDADAAPGQQWTLVAREGAGGTYPHTDSRDWVFSADPNIMFETDDGGIYRLRSAFSTSPSWEEAVGNIRVTEFLSIAYDGVHDVGFGACWDNGVPHQTTLGERPWGVNENGGGDGMQVGGGRGSTPGSSVHYSAIQNFYRAKRQTYTSPRTLAGDEPLRVIINGTAGRTYNQVEGELDPVDPNDLGTIRFIQPWTVNAVDAQRLILPTDYLYESVDGGDHFDALGGLGTNVNGLPIPLNPVGTVHAVAYGHPENPDVLYVGTSGNNPTGTVLWLREEGRGAPVAVETYGAVGGGVPRDIVLSPSTWTFAYVLDERGRVWRTTDRGASMEEWTDLTGAPESPWALSHLSTDLRALEVVGVGDYREALLAAGQDGVFVLQDAAETSEGKWARAGANLPNAIFTDLQYDAEDDKVLAGSYGRGLWSLSEASRKLVPTLPTSRLTIGWPSCGRSGKLAITGATPLTVTATAAAGQVSSIAYRFAPGGTAPPAYTFVSGDSASFTVAGPLNRDYVVSTFASDITGQREHATETQVYLADGQSRLLRGCGIGDRIREWQAYIPPLRNAIWRPLFQRFKRAETLVTRALAAADAGRFPVADKLVRRVEKLTTRLEVLVQAPKRVEAIPAETRSVLFGLARSVRLDIEGMVRPCASCTAASPTCGDGTCDTPAENCSGCPADCGECGGCSYGECTPRMRELCRSCLGCGSCCAMCNCGDGACTGEESCETCPADCGPCTGCGNGTCDAGEDCKGCPADCGCPDGYDCVDGTCS